MIWHSPLGVIHLFSASLALICGAAVMLARKGTLFHRMLGRVWVASMLAVNASALSIYRLTGHFELFHGLALISLLTVLAGLLAVLLKRPGWLMVHYRFMAYGYIGLLAAATAEVVTRLRVIQVHGASAIIAIGLAIGILFVAAGRMMMPRLQRTALSLRP